MKIENEKSLLDDATAIRMAELFSALSDPSRLKIIAALSHGEIKVGEISSLAGISPSAVSHQLRTLRQMRLVRSRKEGREVYYRLDDEHVADLFQRGLEHISHQ